MADDSYHEAIVLASAPKRRSPLWQAAATGNLSSITYLLAQVRHFCDVNRAFFAAAAAGHVGVVLRMLSVEGIDVNAQHPCTLERSLHKLPVPRSALGVAAANGHFMTVVALLSDARVTASTVLRDPSWRTVVQMSPAAANIVYSRFLGEQPSLVLLAAAATGDAALVESALGLPGVDPSTGDNEPLRLAMRYGHMRICDRLLADRRVCPDPARTPALVIAAEEANLTVLEGLCGDGRLARDLVKDAFFAAAAPPRGPVNPEVVRLLLRLGEKASFTAVDALQAAAEAGHAACVKLLLDKTAWMDSAERPDGEQKLAGGCKAALVAAAAVGHAHCVRELLAVPQSTNSAGGASSALMAAAVSGHWDVVELLLSSNYPRRPTAQAVRAHDGGASDDDIDVILNPAGSQPLPEAAADAGPVPGCELALLRSAAAQGAMPFVRYVLANRSRVGMGSDRRFSITVRNSFLVETEPDSRLFTIADRTDNAELLELLFLSECALPSSAVVRPLVQFLHRVRADYSWSAVVHGIADPASAASAYDSLAIRLAAQAGHGALVELLMRQPGVNPAARENSALRLAQAGGRTSVVELLQTDFRVNPAAGDNGLLCLAAAAGNLDEVHRLTAVHSVDAAVANNLPLFRAALNGHWPVVERLASLPRVQHVGGSRAQWVLHCAAAAGELRSTELLLQLSLHDITGPGTNALTAAIGGGHVSIVQRLMQDPRIDVRDRGCADIAFAARCGRVDVLAALLSNRCVDASAHDNAVLRAAAHSRSCDAMDFLLQRRGVQRSLAREPLDFDCALAAALNAFIAAEVKPATAPIIAILGGRFPSQAADGAGVGAGAGAGGIAAAATGAGAAAVAAAGGAGAGQAAAAAAGPDSMSVRVMAAIANCAAAWARRRAVVLARAAAWSE